ncbi:MAG: hypothetical protein JO147_14815 [Actinobacteria bacterium]|nr:hypothetical protein [Actinomycetota bacterium]
MALQSSVVDEEYLPEFGTVVIRDARGVEPTSATPDFPETLSEHFSHAPVCGSFVRTGAGWLHAATSDIRQRVSVEVHDEAPEPIWDREYTEVAEAPFLTRSGVVHVDCKTGRDDGPIAHLGSIRSHRVRIGRADTADGRCWLVQFWPAELALPRRILRTEPIFPTYLAATDPNRYLPLAAALVAIAVWSHGRTQTFEDIAERCQIDYEVLDAGLEYASSGVDPLLVVERVAEGQLRLIPRPSASTRAQHERRRRFRARRADAALRRAAQSPAVAAAESAARHPSNAAAADVARLAHEAIDEEAAD